MATLKKPANKSGINGLQENRAADVPSVVPPPVASFTPNDDQTMSLRIAEGWTQTDWINIFGGLSVAQAEAHKSGNVAEMFGYMRYTTQIGTRLNLGFMQQQASASDLPPPAKARTAAMGA